MLVVLNGYPIVEIITHPRTMDMQQRINITFNNIQGLSYEEVQVIEPEFPLSAAEYAGVEV